MKVMAIIIGLMCGSATAFAASPQCTGDATSGWPSCVRFDTSGTPYLSGVVIGNMFVPGGKTIGAQLGKIQYQELNAYMVAVNDQVVLKFNDGSADIAIGTISGQKYPDAYGFSYSQELVLAPGLGHTNSTQSHNMPPTYDTNDAPGICEAVVNREVDTVMTLSSAGRSYDFIARGYEFVSSTPAPGQCK